MSLRLFPLFLLLPSLALADEETRVYEIDLPRTEAVISTAELRHRGERTLYFFYQFTGSDDLAKVRILRHEISDRKIRIWDYYLMYDDEVDVFEREIVAEALPEFLRGELGETELEDSYQIDPTAKRQEGVPLLGKHRERTNAVRMLRDALTLERTPVEPEPEPAPETSPAP